MDYRNDSSENSRNKCAACFRQFNKKEHLVEHMRISFHSVHEPKCGICKKHCRSFESLREHLIGKYFSKQECKNIFNVRGCRFCLTILDSSNARRAHQDRCQFPFQPGTACSSGYSRLARQLEYRKWLLQRDTSCCTSV